MAVMAHEGSEKIMFDVTAIPLGASSVDGYLARPDLLGSVPCVVVLHGQEGLLPYERALCRTLARHGYAAIAPDLFRGGQSRNERSQLTDSRALTDVGEVIEFLDSEDTPWADPTNVVLLGYDVGGRLALTYASRNGGVGGVISISGPLAAGSDGKLTAIEEVGRINGAVLGLYGAADPSVSLKDVDAAQSLTNNGTWIVYESAGHGFIDSGSEEFDAGAEADAVQRILSLLRAILR
jgi:carboxymethylenebutenolidase